MAIDFVCSRKLECGLWAARFSIRKWFEWPGALPDGSSDGCSVCRIEPAVGTVVYDGSTGSPYEKHLDSGDQALVMLHAEVRDREVLFEQFSVESPGVFGDSVGMIVLNGKEQLRGLWLGLVVLVCFHFGSVD